MFWTTRQNSRPASRHTRLAVEKFEERCLMSATPMSAPLPEPPAQIAAQQAGAETESERDDAYEGNSLSLGTARFSMAGTSYQVFNANQDKFQMGAQPFATVWNNKLVIFGTNSKDVAHVQENPVTNAKDPNSDSYIVKVDYGTGRTAGHYKESFSRSLIKESTILFYGLNGDDTFTFITLDKNSKTAVFADGGKGADKLTGGPHWNFLDGGVNDASKDTLIGGAGDDILAGGPGPDELTSNAGNDVLWGEQGDDKLMGDGGTDYLFGGDDNDTLLGGNQKDHLYGGQGKDVLDGGVGESDVLWGEADADRFAIDGTAKLNRDQPQDFKPAEKDTYWLNGKQVPATTLLGLMDVDLTGMPKKK